MEKEIRGRKRIENKKKKVNIRIDKDVVKRLKEKGKGWKGSMKDEMRKDVGI